MNLKIKSFNWGHGGIGNYLVKINELGSEIVATGTNEEKNKLKMILKNYIEKFKLDEHHKIEEFINKINEKLEIYLVNNTV